MSRLCESAAKNLISIKLHLSSEKGAFSFSEVFNAKDGLRFVQILPDHCKHCTLTPIMIVRVKCICFYNKNPLIRSPLDWRFYFELSEVRIIGR